jgi:hypothetical protein
MPSSNEVAIANQNALRALLSQALNVVRANEGAERAAGTTLESAIVQAIYEIDSSQVNVVEELSGETSARMSSTRPKMGRLQQVQSLKLLLFGDKGNNGLFEQLRNLPPNTR